MRMIHRGVVALKITMLLAIKIVSWKLRHPEPRG